MLERGVYATSLFGSPRAKGFVCARADLEAAGRPRAGGSVRMPRREPRCRIARELIPLEGGRKWVRFGGFGNSSGKQGERDPGFKIWNDQFHGRGDLWVLDLANGKWECIVPAPGLELPNSHACADVAEHNALLMVPAHDNATPEGTPPEIHVLRLEKGANF